MYHFAEQAIDDREVRTALAGVEAEILAEALAAILPVLDELEAEARQ
jgi:hypothetical protein